MNNLPFLKRFCPAPIQRYCSVPPVCRYLEPVTGDCIHPKNRGKMQEYSGVLSGRNWT